MAPCHLIFLVTLQILRPVVTDERVDAWGGRGGDGRGGWEGGGVFGVRSISHWPVPTARASGKCSSPWTSSSPGTLRSEFGRGETQGRVLEGAACRPALLTCPSVRPAAERCHGRRAPEHVLHAAGADAPGTSVCAVCAAGAGRPPAAGARHLPVAQPGE